MIQGARVDVAPPRPPVPAARLVVTLGVGGAAAGLLLVVVFHLTQPTIQAYRARMLELAIGEVLNAPERYETLFLRDGELIQTPPADTDTRTLERIFVGYRGDQSLGFAMVGAGPGFQDTLRLIFGYDVGTESLLGMKVLESKETPGLGDKIEKDAAFVAQFAGARPPLAAVKQGRAGNDRTRIDMITGATISSRAVVRIINRELERLRPALERYEARR